MRDNDTIAAISTPRGSGGIAIIRISGEDAFSVADRILCRRRDGVLSSFVSQMQDHTVAHCYAVAGAISAADGFAGAAAANCGGEAGPEVNEGYACAKGTEGSERAAGAEPGKGAAAGRAAARKPEIIDECLVTRFDAPRTYTTENIVEINSHGGPAATARILSLVLENGARAADPGEFTKRAFLAGRISLDEAESVMDIINAGAESSRRAAVAGLTGRLGQELGRISGLLTEALADIDVSIDYPEYDFDRDMGSAAAENAAEALGALKRLSDSYFKGRLAREGIRVAFAGSPNAGKSSLMNIFSGHDRSIVTDVPGTTRDTVDEFIQLEGFPLRLTDTAGIRETDDPVEREGVRRSKDAIDNADLILYIIDSNDPHLPDEGTALDPARTVFVLNKSDLPNRLEDIDGLRARFGEGVMTQAVSALTGEGIPELFARISGLFALGSIDFSEGSILTSLRHKQLADEAAALLGKALESLAAGLPLDVFSYDLRLANEKLCEILGKNVTDEVLESIFSRFCVGK
ncbi:MAG: tRNA uridine-5-carboxymethylaminomethyl(34) synthesis GTPase MnmE [Clostridia bacterium]|nr:tRNA uridine-5-carboxymethylaminomethyl(34) synthesis GTPase MnmE [Clostridia bacterium]